MLTILEGSTFCICDDAGDVGEQTSGFFAHDTRFLSVFRLRVNGRRPLLLTSAKIEYFSAAFYLRNPVVDGLAQDTLSISRRRFVGDGMQERVFVRNEGADRVSFTLSLEVESDFADIMSVKEHDFALGNPEHARPLPAAVAPTYDEANNQFVLADPGDVARTQVIFSKPGRVNGSGVSWEIELGPRESWQVQADVVASPDGAELTPRVAERRFGTELNHVRESLAAWQLRVPQLRTTWDDLARAFSQSVADLAALRMRSAADPGAGRLPAAGMPWFMTVFGRDTLITCLQTLLFGPELARTALEVLADLQALEDDPSIDAEPGKIVHEVRTGKAAQHWFTAYYGTVDATPLFLILLSEVWRWTGDDAFVTRLRPAALRALEWIDAWGDRDGDGFVEYERRSPHGLANQSWKDSGDSQRFADGRFGTTPIAPVEVQGYVYDAKLRVAELAREVWRERELAERLENEARALRERFDAAFWVKEGGYYALALDRDKAQVDSLCSNVGHLLWSGIVSSERVEDLVDALMGNGLWSGWGVRTMSDACTAYNPLSYHNGTVWPHDNSLIAWGLTRYGRWHEASRIAHSLFTAARHFDYQLPEVFAGLPRAETSIPIAYPTAARPQAWAAGTPVLLLQLLLGIRPDTRRQVLVSDAPELPSWAEDLSLVGIRAFDRRWNVVAVGGRVHVEEA